MQNDVVFNLDFTLGVGVNFQNFLAENLIVDQPATRVALGFEYGNYVVKMASWGERML